MFLDSKKKLVLVPIPLVRQTGWSGTEKFGLSQNAQLNMSRVLNSKCPKHIAL
jgi:hypothetical protein